MADHKLKCPKCDHVTGADKSKCPNCGHDLAAARKAKFAKLNEAWSEKARAAALAARKAHRISWDSKAFDDIAHLRAVDKPKATLDTVRKLEPFDITPEGARSHLRPDRPYDHFGFGGIKPAHYAEAFERVAAHGGNSPAVRRRAAAIARVTRDSMKLREAKDSMRKASTPEPFSASKTSNWVARAGGLPAYIQHIAHDLMEKRGKSESNAIQMAIGIVKNWASGQGNVDATTRAAAAKAWAQWIALKAKNAAKKAVKRISEAEEGNPLTLLEAVERLGEAKAAEATLADREVVARSLNEAVLSAKERKASATIKRDGGKFPIPDKGHAKAALARINQSDLSPDEKAKVRAKALKMLRNSADLDGEVVADRLMEGLRGEWDAIRHPRDRTGRFRDAPGALTRGVRFGGMQRGAASPGIGRPKQLTMGDVPPSQRRSVAHVHRWIKEHLDGKGYEGSFADDTVDVKRGLVTHAAGLLSPSDRTRFVKKLRHHGDAHGAAAKEAGEKFGDFRHPSSRRSKEFHTLADHIEKVHGGARLGAASPGVDTSAEAKRPGMRKMARAMSDEALAFQSARTPDNGNIWRQEIDRELGKRAAAQFGTASPGVRGSTYKVGSHDVPADGRVLVRHLGGSRFSSPQVAIEKGVTSHTFMHRGGEWRLEHVDTYGNGSGTGFPSPKVPKGSELHRRLNAALAHGKAYRKRHPAPEPIPGTVVSPMNVELPRAKDPRYRGARSPGVRMGRAAYNARVKALAAADEAKGLRR